MSKALGEEPMCQSLVRFLGLVINHDRESYLRYILHYFRERWLSAQG